EGDFVAGSLRAARAHGLPHELLSRSALAARFPQFTGPDDWGALFEPSAGFLVPERVLAAHCGLALRHGAELHAHEPVVEWRATGGGVTVKTERATYNAARLILCTGAWAGRAVAGIPGVAIRATRQVMGWV